MLTPILGKTASKRLCVCVFCKQISLDSDRFDLVCPLCCEKFFTTYGLGSHLDAVHGSQYKMTIPLPCRHCKSQFQGLEKLADHMWIVHRCSSSGSETHVAASTAGADDNKSDAASKKYSTSSKGQSSNASVPYGSITDIVPFVDFCCGKFTFLAQVLSERNPIRKTQKPSVHASSATPSRSVISSFEPKKQLHPCSSCELVFESRTKCAEHILQCHDVSTVIAEFTRISDSADPGEGNISQEEFCLAMGLRVSINRTAAAVQLTSPTAGIANKCAIVDANRNILKTEFIPSSVPNGQATPVLFGHLLALAGSVSQILPGPMPVLRLPSVSMFQKSIHQAFSSTASPVFVTGTRSLQSVPAIVTPIVSGVIPTSTMSGVSVLKKPVEATTCESSTNVVAAVGQSPSDNDGLDQTNSAEKDGTNNVGTYRCSSCDDSFISYRAYRGHMVSVHLGTSPYKCPQCAYASADRSTLIRHLRTHNGERPFQCLICEFAFTTKANCERHVRKKHGLDSKEDMDRSIGYSRYSKELPSANGELGLLSPICDNSANTICKYCGEDFKFYRTLKHHLRSQSSCSHKPFTCRSCSVGFSTKANCLRHIQKRHTPLAVGTSPESLMSVNEVMLAAQQNTSNVSPSSRCSSVTSLLESRQKQEVEGPPVKKPRFDSSLMPAHVNGAYTIKQENIATAVSHDYDEPLDFSVKSTSNPRPDGVQMLSLPSSAELQIDDQPIDLSVGSRNKESSSCGSLLTNRSLIDNDLSPVPLVITSKNSTPGSSSSHLRSSLVTVGKLSLISPVVRGVRQSVSGMKHASSAKCWQCSNCNALFKSRPKLMVHMRTHITEPVRHCSHCAAEFQQKADFDSHMKTEHPQFADINTNTSSNDSSIFNESHLDAMAENPEGKVVELNNNIPEAVNANLCCKLLNTTVQQSTMAKRQSAPAATITSEAESDLSSVKHILNAASPTQFSALFNNEGTSCIVTNKNLTSVIESAGPSNAENLNKSNSDVKLMNELSMKRKRNSYADSPHKLRCPYCPRAFPWISSLKRHILTHTGQKPFKCPQCPVTFSTKSNRERHMIRKHGLDVHDPATRHMMDRPYKCHLCIFSSFATSGKLIKHYKTKHSDREFPEGLLASLPNMSQEELTSALTKLGATFGGGDAASGALNLTGEQGDSDDTQDFDMDDSDEDDDSLTSENLERAAEAMVDAVVRTIAKVPSSQVVLDGLPNVPVHSQSESQIPSVDGNSHVAASRSSTNPERDNYNVDRITECWQCKMVFDCRKSLLRHLKEHGVDLPFKCYLCDASFASRADSLVHKESAHATDWSLLRDKNRVGEDLVDFATFVDRVVDEALAGGSVAPVTARRMRDGVELDVRLESDYAQRKVFCSLCPKRFWSLQDLRRHMRSHTGERPFACDVCHARFTLKHSMMRHRRKHEGNGGADVGDTQSDSDEESLAEQNTDMAKLKTSVAQVSSASKNASFGQIALPDLIQSMPNVTRNSVVRHMSSSMTSNNTSSVAADGEGHSDLLQNLLGVSDAATIEHMLDSAVDGTISSQLKQCQVNAELEAVSESA